MEHQFELIKSRLLF